MQRLLQKGEQEDAYAKTAESRPSRLLQLASVSIPCEDLLNACPARFRRIYLHTRWRARPVLRVTPELFSLRRPAVAASIRFDVPLSGILGWPLLPSLYLCPVQKRGLIFLLFLELHADPCAGLRNLHCSLSESPLEPLPSPSLCFQVKLISHEASSDRSQQVIHGKIGQEYNSAQVSAIFCSCKWAD